MTDRIIPDSAPASSQPERMEEPKRVGALVSVAKDWKMGARGVAMLGVDGRWIVYHDGGTGYDRCWSDLRDPQPLTPEQLSWLAGPETPASAALSDPEANAD